MKYLLKVAGSLILTIALMQIADKLLSVFAIIERGGAAQRLTEQSAAACPLLRFRAGGWENFDLIIDQPVEESGCVRLTAGEIAARSDAARHASSLGFKRVVGTDRTGNTVTRNVEEEK